MSKKLLIGFALMLLVSLVCCGGIGDKIRQWHRMAINDKEKETATGKDAGDGRIVKSNCPDGYVVDCRGNCREQFD